MNTSTRAEQYNASLDAYQETTAFYVNRLYRTRDMVLTIWSKQYLNKFTIQQVQEIAELSFLFDLENVSLQRMDTNSQRGKFSLLGTHTVTENNAIVNKIIHVPYVFIHGSDRDIAKRVRQILATEYSHIKYQYFRENLQFNRDKMKDLQQELESTQQEIESTEHTIHTLESQFDRYYSTKKAPGGIK